MGGRRSRRTSWSSSRPTTSGRTSAADRASAVLHARPDVHVLIVDDDSPDGTGELADELAAGRPRPGARHAPHRQGRPRAPPTWPGSPGALDRGYSVLVEMDADGSPRPRGTAPAAATPSTRRRPGDRLALRSRAGRCATGRGGGMVLSRGANRYSRVLLGVDIHDITAGYRAYRRRGAGEDRPRRRRLEGLLLPDRPDLARINDGFTRRRGADHVHRARARVNPR